MIISHYVTLAVYSVVKTVGYFIDISASCLLCSGTHKGLYFCLGSLRTAANKLTDLETFNTVSR